MANEKIETEISILKIYRKRKLSLYDLVSGVIKLKKKKIYHCENLESYF